MSVNRGPKIVTTGLIGYYDTGNPNSYAGSGSVITDLSGKGNHGTVVGTPSYTYESNLGNVLRFQNDSSKITTSIDITNSDFTFGCWIKPINNVGSAIFVFGHGNSYTAYSGLHVWIDTPTSLLYGLWGGDYYVNPGFTFGNWYHLTFTYSNTSPFPRNIYINGSFFSSTSVDQYLGVSGSGIKIGDIYGTSDVNNWGFGGDKSIRHATIYNRVLTDEEVRQNFNAHRMLFGV